MSFADKLQEPERKMRNIAHMLAKGRRAQALIRLEEKFGCNENGFYIVHKAGRTWHLIPELRMKPSSASLMNLYRMEFVQDEVIELSGKEIQIKDTGKLLNFSRQSIGEV